MTAILVRRKHLAENQICSRGARAWFAQHGFDYNDFLKNGMAVEKMEGTGDHFALMVSRSARAEAAQKEVSDGQG